jgi:hypothetical protein
MKGYYIFFLILKIIILSQFVLIIMNKQSIDSRIFILTEIVFKTSLFVFIQLFLFFNVGRDLDFEDKVIFSFAAGLLLYDAWFNDMRRLLDILHVKVPILNP